MKTKITKIQLLFLVSILFSSSLFAQAIIKSGYIKTLEGEQKWGYIKLTDLKKAGEQVIFSELEQATLFRRYLPTEIIEYGIDDQIQYQSFSFYLLDEYQIPSDNRVTRFLRVISEGKIKLLQYENPKKEQYFLFSDEELIPLVYQKEEVQSYENYNGRIVVNGASYENLSSGDTFKDEQGNFYIFEDKLYKKSPEYITTLRRKLGAYKSIQIAPNFEYDKGSFSKLVHQYNQWASPYTAKTNNKPKFIQLALIAYGGRTNYYYERFGHQEIGLMAEVRNNYRTPNVSLAIGIGITNSGTSTYVLPYIAPFNNGGIELEDLAEETVKFQTTTFRLNYHFRPQKQLRPFVYGGVKFLRALTTVENFTRPDVATPANTRSLFTEHLGVGLDYYLKRFQLRTEIGFAGSFYSSIGVGYLLIR